MKTSLRKSSIKVSNIPEVFSSWTRNKIHFIVKTAQSQGDASQMTYFLLVLVTMYECIIIPRRIQNCLICQHFSIKAHAKSLWFGFSRWWLFQTFPSWNVYQKPSQSFCIPYFDFPLVFPHSFSLFRSTKHIFYGFTNEIYWILTLGFPVFLVGACNITLNCSNLMEKDKVDFDPHLVMKLLEHEVN